MNLKLRVVRLPEDPLGFVRRECSACHRQWKTKAWGSDAAAIHRRLARHLHHENPDELFATLVAEGTRACPYCGHTATAESFFTAQQRSHIEHVANAYGNLVRHELLMQVHRTLSHNPYPTFVPMKPEAPPPPLRDDQDDLRAVHFVCCGEDTRVERYWRRNLHCSRCGIEHLSSTARATFMMPQALG